MTVSAVPLPSAFFNAILCQLGARPDGVRRRELYELVADAMALSPMQRAERLPSLTHLRYRHRIGWSMNLLKNSGLIDSPAPGFWRLTAPGTELVATYPNGFSEEMTRSIARKARAVVRVGGQEQNSDAEVETEPSSQQPPEERIDSAVDEVRSAVATELLERIMQASPAFFEALVLDLLHALGYGTTSDDLQHVGSPGDGGIDGVISLDKLGFEKVFVQAKRWQGSVGRPDIQGFFGALAGRRAKKGVFITTSTFTKDAQEFAAQVSDSIVIIDGSRLTELMIDHGVAVTHYRVIRLPRVDGDYFDA
jgi:restriction system protein